MKIQRDREQNQEPAFSDQALAAELSVRPERWAAAVQSQRACHLLDLTLSPIEPTSPIEGD